MNIGQLAKSSGVNAKLIRHYESIGLLPKAARTESGYRVYSENDVHTLRFLKRARNLGFAMKDIKQLIGLWRNRGRKSGDVKKLAQEHLNILETKIVELQTMAKSIRHLVHNCHGDGRPDCPILDDLGKV